MHPTSILPDMKNALTALFFIMLAGSLLATPTISSLSLRSGSNMPRYNGEFVRAIYSVDNPDDTPADLTVQVVPDGASGGVFYYRSFTLPPHCKIQGFFPVVFSPTNSYTYRLIQHLPSGDVELMHSDIPMMRSQPQASQAQAGVESEEVDYVMNSEDFLYIAAIRGNSKTYQSFPNLYKDRAIHSTARFLPFSQHSDYAPPANLAEYLQMGAVLLLEERYDKFNLLQFNALNDYVRGGGLLIVAGSAPTQGIYQSPLRPLLPVTPAGVRKLEDGNALRKAWGLPAKEYQLRDQYGDLLEIPGYEFQEVAVAEGAKVFKRLDDLPMVVAWHYGLGTVVWLAFDPVEFTANELEVRATLWNHLLHFANHIPRSLRPDRQLLLEGVQQQLLGYSIPPFRTLGLYLIGYIVFATLLLLVSSRLNHPATGWGLVCILGVLLTLAIVTHAHNLSANQPHRQINSITVRTWDGAPGPLVAYTNLASREDTSLDLQLDNNTGFIFPSPPKPSVESTETALERSRLLVNTDGQKTSLVKLTLQENRPRAANWSLASRELETPPLTQLPTLEVAPDGKLQLAEWTVPDCLRPFNRALLVLPSAIKPLNHSADHLAGIAQDTVENDTVFVQVQEYLAARQLRTPALCLVSIQRTETLGKEIHIECEDGTFGAYDYQLTLIPLRVQWPTQGDTFTIPAELTWMCFDANSMFSRSWAYGKCTGLSLAYVTAVTDELQSKRTRVPVPIALPITTPAGELQNAIVHYSLLENSSTVDVEPRLFDKAGNASATPIANSPQSSSFGADAAMAYNPDLTRFTVHFVPFLTTQPTDSADSELGNPSSRDQSWWLNQAQAELVFRRQNTSSAP